MSQENTTSEKTQEKKKEYRVENKYDPYLIRNEFNTYIEDQLTKLEDYQVSHIFEHRKILYGLIITIIILVSHFYPIPWPSNYYLLIGCIFGYYIISWIYQNYEEKVEKNCFLLLKHKKTNQYVRVNSAMELCSDFIEIGLGFIDSNQPDYFSDKYKVGEYIDKRGYLCEKKLEKLVEVLINEMKKKTK